MRLMSLDPGHATGWCIIEAGQVMQHGTFTSAHNSRKKGCEMSWGGRLNEWASWFRAMLDTHCVTDVVVEEPEAPVGIAGRVLVYGRYVNCLQVLEDRTEIAHDCDPVSVKMWAAGRGNADKVDMILACERMTGLEVN